MKEQWQRLELRIDALNLRERAMAFAITALILITLVNMLLLDPLLAKETQISQQVRQQQQQIAAMQAEIQTAVKSSNWDPDASSRFRLTTLRQDQAKLHDEMVALQKGLVSPDRMTALLEDLLKRNGKLHLASLKKLPVVALNDQRLSSGNEAESKAGKPGIAPSKEKTGGDGASEALYQHGVEIVVEGGYLDIMNYLSQLEAMPWQLFWSKARLDADAYPKASLTLILFTLSLDKTWLNI
jgi:MSHA biogenesis protein MshJ